MSRSPSETENDDRPVPDGGAARGTAWGAKPVVAWTIRFGTIAVPLAGAWLAVRLAVQAVPRPSGTGATVAWVGGAVALSTLVYYLGRRLLDRFSSLGVLYRLSLTFPETPPSRMSAIVRAVDVDKLRSRMTSEDSGSLHAPRRQAERLVELVTAVTRRERVNRGHADRVRAYAEAIGVEMGLSDDEIQKLRWSALLHDIGMLDVPRGVADRPGPLSSDAHAIVRDHPVAAVHYLEPFGAWLGEWSLAATDHHERWDGSGYPLGLAGTEISLGGRIVAVADAYDAMTATRSYQKPRSAADARQELVDQAGAQFDPDVVRAFLNANISRSRAAAGPLAALMELPAQLGAQLTATAPAAVSVTAGVAAASTVAAVASLGAPSVLASDGQTPAPAFERVVTPSTSAPTTSEPASTTEPPQTSTTRPRFVPSTTTSTTTTTTTTTTTVRPAAPAPTTQPPANTTTTTTTTTAPPAPTTTTVPAYPTTPPTVPDYPEV